LQRVHADKILQKLRENNAPYAASSGASERAITAQTGHKPVTMDRRYIQRGSVVRDNAVGHCQ
jgi:hypothetical protein